MIENDSLSFYKSERRELWRIARGVEPYLNHTGSTLAGYGPLEQRTIHLRFLLTFVEPYEKKVFPPTHPDRSEAHLCVSGHRCPHEIIMYALSLRIRAMRTSTT